MKKWSIFHVWTVIYLADELLRRSSDPPGYDDGPPLESIAEFPSCSILLLAGFSRPAGHPTAGELLPRLFTLTDPIRRNGSEEPFPANRGRSAVSFSVALSLTFGNRFRRTGDPRVPMSRWTLSTATPYEARTFLPSRYVTSDRLVSIFLLHSTRRSHSVNPPTIATTTRFPCKRRSTNGRFTKR